MYFKVLQGKAGGGGWSHSSDVSQNCARARALSGMHCNGLPTRLPSRMQDKFDFGSKN
jgi:hypothetical protein